VGARHTYRELVAVQRRIGEETRSVSDASALDVVGNRIEVYLGVVDDASLAFLAQRYPADAICVVGPTPEELVPEGPQPQTGEGWRVLADAPGIGPTWDTSAALDKAAYRELWAELGLPGERPPVDFVNEIVVHFGPAVSGSCPEIRLDGLLVRGDLVLPDIVRPGIQPSACTADANPHTYLLAVERSALPTAPFRLRVTDCETCNDADVTVVAKL
jgi:hypothetical protein